MTVDPSHCSDIRTFQHRHRRSSPEAKDLLHNESEFQPLRSKPMLHHLE